MVEARPMSRWHKDLISHPRLRNLARHQPQQRHLIGDVHDLTLDTTGLLRDRHSSVAQFRDPKGRDKRQKQIKLCGSLVLE
jgi:hypothetical protein